MGLKWSECNAPKPKVQSGNSFDDLSNEILLELFDYLSCDEIYFSFFGLNSYINNLIECYPQAVDIQSSHIMPKHIRSIKINQRCLIPRLSTIAPSQLNCLRALTVSNLSSSSVFKILQDLPIRQLQYVYLGAFDESEANNGQAVASIQAIMLTLGQHGLRRCHFRNKLLVDVESLPHTLPSLTHLRVDCCQDFSVVSKLLVRLPNLKSLSVSTLDLTKDPLPLIPTSVVRLAIRLNRFNSSNEFIEFFTNCCPNVKNLVIQTSSSRLDQSMLLNEKERWLPIVSRSVKTLHIVSLYLNPDEQLMFSTKLPIQYRILSNSNNSSEHFCEVHVDAPFSETWFLENRNT